MMDTYAWILFIALTVVVVAIIIGLVKVVADTRRDFDELLTVNAELDARLNKQLDDQLKERTHYSVIDSDYVLVNYLLECD